MVAIAGACYGAAAPTGKAKKVAPVAGRLFAAGVPSGWAHRTASVRGTVFAAADGWHLGREHRAVSGRLYAAAYGFGVVSEFVRPLETMDRLHLIRAWLEALLGGAGVTVFVDEPAPGGPAPFVVITGTMTPARVSLAGAWDVAQFTVTWWAVHDTRLQARAVGDLVAAAFLRPSARLVLPGTMDVQPGADPAADLVGGVPQVRSGAVFALSAT